MSVIFIDFEASSLMRGSFPIEVGLAVDSGPVHIWLIRPAPGWEEWSPASQAIHGISLAQLHADGADVGTVAASVQDLCSAPDCVLASDNPAHEQLWLDRLMDAAGLHRVLHVQGAEAVYHAEACRLLQLAPPATALWHERVYRSLEAEARSLVQDCHAAELQRTRTRHRAGPDAEGMRSILDEVRIRVDARLAAAGSPEL